MPCASSDATSDITALVGRLQMPDTDVETRSALESTLDAAVYELFGLKEAAGQA